MAAMMDSSVLTSRRAPKTAPTLQDHETPLRRKPSPSCYALTLGIAQEVFRYGCIPAARPYLKQLNDASLADELSTRRPTSAASYRPYFRSSFRCFADRKNRPELPARRVKIAKQSRRGESGNPINQVRKLVDVT